MTASTATVGGGSGVRRSGALVIGLMVFSLAISAGLWVLATRQLLQLASLLRQASQERGRAAEILADVARAFQLSMVPRLLIVDSSISPLLWAGLRRSAIVLPKALLSSIHDEQLRQIFAHELAHLVRGDHWTNLFAFFVTSLFWWHPVSWLARRELRAAAESCCDAMAIERLAGSRRSYAATLLAVVDYVNRTDPIRPLVTITFGQSQALKRRIEMVANQHVKGKLTGSSRLLVACAVLSLTLLPARAQQPLANPPESGSNQQALTVKPTTEDDQRVVVTLDFVRGRQGKYLLPDYLPAAHGNAVQAVPDHYFMLQPLGSPRQWHIIYSRDSGDGTGRTLWDAKLVIPDPDKLKQRDTFVLHNDRDLVVVAFVEDDYVNDRDIGVKLIDIRSGRVVHKCTLLRHMSRYQQMADLMSQTDPDQGGQSRTEDSEEEGDQGVGTKGGRADAVDGRHSEASYYLGRSR
jgi:beta-lactamase regulating signal transducer with metallopeptidase domain